MRCVIDLCEGEVIARGWCNMHYRRWRRTGETGPARTQPDPSDYYVDRDTRRIPCRDRFGAIRLWVLVDVQDFEHLNSYLWHYGSRYVRRRVVVDGRVRLQKLHNEVFGLPFDSGFEVDHIDRDPLNNRRSNLRILELGMNQQNATKAKGKTSQYRGVSLSNGSWLAMVTHDGRQHYGGRHATEVDAAHAAAELRLRILPVSTE